MAVRAGLEWSSGMLDAFEQIRPVLGRSPRSQGNVASADKETTLREPASICAPLLCPRF
jgi:hypothetical protein